MKNQKIKNRFLSFIFLSIFISVGQIMPVLAYSLTQKEIVDIESLSGYFGVKEKPIKIYTLVKLLQSFGVTDVYLFIQQFITHYNIPDVYKVLKAQKIVLDPKTGKKGDLTNLSFTAQFWLFLLSIVNLDDAPKAYIVKKVWGENYPKSYDQVFNATQNALVVHNKEVEKEIFHLGGNEEVNKDLLAQIKKYHDDEKANREALEKEQEQEKLAIKEKNEKVTQQEKADEKKEESAGAQKEITPKNFVPEGKDNPQEQGTKSLPKNKTIQAG